jgi:hypothetical protein
MSWHRICGVFVLIVLFGVLLRPGTTGGIAQAVGVQVPVAQAAPAGVPVVVRSGGADLYDNPNGATVRQLETGTIAQALSRTPGGDWIFIEVEAGVQGWLPADKLVSVNPAALPVYGRPQAEQINQPAASSTPVQEPSPTPEPTATATETATSTPTATATATLTSTPTNTLQPTATSTALPDTAPASIENRENAVASRPAPVLQHTSANSSNPYLQAMGVVRSGGASLTDGPSGGELASLPAGEIVTLLRRSEDDGWLEVARKDSSSGWVARAELLTAGIAKLSRLGEEVAPAVVEATAPAVEEAAPLAEAGPGLSLVLATVRTDGSRLNVRSGPGSDFSIIAKADNASSYPALSMDESAAWVQIEITDAPDGTGWVSARYVALNGPIGESE